MSDETVKRRGRKLGSKLPPPSPPIGAVAKPKNQHFVTGISRATAYRLEAAGLFPKRRKLTPGGAVGWLVSELIEWRDSREQAE